MKEMNRFECLTEDRMQRVVVKQHTDGSVSVTTYNNRGNEWVTMDHKVLISQIQHPANYVEVIDVE